MGEGTNLGSFIRECRTGLKYTSRQVAKLANSRNDIPSISNSYLISVENGKHIPRLDKVIALAEVLNVPVSQLIDRCREDIGARIKAPDGADFHVLFETGLERAEMNEHAQALELFRQARQALQPRSNGNGNGSGHHASAVAPEDLAELHLQMANCYRRLKINRVAKDELESLLKSRDSDARLRARASFALAEIYREEGSAFLAGVVAREALRIAEECSDEVLQAKLASSLGNLCAEEGRHDEALAFFRDAATRLKALGHTRAALLARARQAIVLVEKRDFYRAIDLLRPELGSCPESDPYTRGWLHIALAKAYYGAENYKSARAHARTAKDCGDRLEALDLTFLSLYYLWAVARRERTDDTARAYFERLKYYRNKLEISCYETDQFDQVRRQLTSRTEKGVQ